MYLRKLFQNPLKDDVGPAVTNMPNVGSSVGGKSNIDTKMSSTDIDDTVPSTATEESASSSTSEEEFEIRVVVRSEAAREKKARAATAAIEQAKHGSAERTTSKCEYCTGKKVKTCANSACKKCCARQTGECAVHSKTQRDTKPKEAAAPPAAEPVPVQSRRLRKPVFKNEFKEANVAYYNETVVLFCARDFFEAKKISQPIINDQIRALRVNGMNAAIDVNTKAPKKRPATNPELKARVLAAVHDGMKRRKVEAM